MPRVLINGSRRRFAGRTAGAVKRDVRKAAETHAPDGGYGDTWFRSSDGKVFWNAADWSTQEEVDAARDGFLDIDGVNDFDSDAEVGNPDGDGWDQVWPAKDEASADLAEILALASAPLDLEPETLSLKPGMTELVASIEETAFPLVAFGDDKALLAALEAIAMSHRTTVDTVAAVMASAAATERGGGSSKRGDEIALAALRAVESFASRPAPLPAPITIHVPPTHVNVEGATVHVPEQAAQPAPIVNVEAQPAPIVNVHVPEQAAQEPPVINVSVPETKVDVHVAAAEAPHVEVHVPDQRPRAVRVEYDAQGNKRYVSEEVE